MLGGIDILVHNAGIQFVSPVEDFSPERWSAIQNIILNSSFHAIREVGPGMKQRSWGWIINLASVHGLVSSPFISSYIAAKHGQIELPKTVALKLPGDPHHLQRNLFGLGADAAARGLDRQPDHGPWSAPRARHLGGDHRGPAPMKRFGEVSEVAALAGFRCSESARSITGAAIPIEGGWTAW